MMPLSKIIMAVQLAEQAHRDQVDQAGDPYINHPLRVAFDLAESGAAPETVVVGLLHDAAEDGNLSLELVRSVFGEAVASALDAVSHRKNEPREQYLRRIVAYGRTAIAVKMADYRDNLNEGRLAKLPPDVSARLRAKYEKEIDRVISMVAN